MANIEQIRLLKQGVDFWNNWRVAHPHVEVDLRFADLHGINLSRINLSMADLRGINLTNANLMGANFVKAFLFQANLNNADLSRAILRDAHLFQMSLDGTILFGTNFCESLVRKADFRNARLGSTVLGSIDLSKAINLDFAVHQYPSILGTDTLRMSKGGISEKFMQGCGLSDWEIESSKLHNPDLSNEEINKILYRMYDIRAEQPLQISPIFISYSHADSAFVDRLELSLNRKGVRFWRDIHAATSGRLEKQIDRAIHQNPTVLLILSKNSIMSDWVQHEVRLARDLEKATERDVLCPLSLDDSWKSSKWPQRIMEQVMEYNILDFSKWRDDSKFTDRFEKLIDGLNLYYKK
jgi:hypothetical protein